MWRALTPDNEGVGSIARTFAAARATSVRPMLKAGPSLIGGLPWSIARLPLYSGLAAAATLVALGTTALLQDGGAIPTGASPVNHFALRLGQQHLW